MNNFFSFLFGALAFFNLISHDGNYQKIIAYGVAALLFALYDIADAIREKKHD